MTEGEAAARAYLENMDCERGIYIFKSEKELKAIKRRLEKCCPDETVGVRVFLPDNGRDWSKNLTLVEMKNNSKV